MKDNHSIPERPATARRIRTIVVEDSPVALSAVCALLEGNPAVEIVGTARGGEDAIGLAGRLEPDLVVTDLHMPGCGGLEVVEHLRKKFPAMRLVIISTDAGAIWEELSRTSGADAFVPKHRLYHEIEELLRRLFPDAEAPRADSRSLTKDSL